MKNDSLIIECSYVWEEKRILFFFFDHRCDNRFHCECVCVCMFILLVLLVERVVTSARSSMSSRKREKKRTSERARKMMCPTCLDTFIHWWFFVCLTRCREREREKTFLFSLFLEAYIFVHFNRSLSEVQTPDVCENKVEQMSMIFF